MAGTYRDQIVAGVAKAKAKLKANKMLATIKHFPTTGRDQFGVTHGGPNNVDALVEDVGEIVIDDDGNEAMAHAKLTIFDPLVVKQTDKFSVEDDEEVHVAKRKSLLDADKKPYLVEVWLGRGKLGT
jgi:hypothetical protein